MSLKEQLRGKRLSSLHDRFMQHADSFPNFMVLGVRSLDESKLPVLRAMTQPPTSILRDGCYRSALNQMFPLTPVDFLIIWWLGEVKRESPEEFETLNIDSKNELAEHAETDDFQKRLHYYRSNADFDNGPLQQDYSHWGTPEIEPLRSLLLHNAVASALHLGRRYCHVERFEQLYYGGTPFIPVLADSEHRLRGADQSADGEEWEDGEDAYSKRVGALYDLSRIAIAEFNGFSPIHGTGRLLSFVEFAYRVVPMKRMSEGLFEFLVPLTNVFQTCAIAIERMSEDARYFSGNDIVDEVEHFRIPEKTSQNSDALRDEWIYHLAMDGTLYGTIRIQLDKIATEKGWGPISTDSGVRDRAKNYANRNGLPLPPRRQGMK